MIITAEQKNTRQTPTRLRLVAHAIKKMPLESAMLQLRFMDKKAAVVMEKVFKQAVANATKNLGLSLDSLTIKDIIVGEGPRYKRFQPVSRGRAHSILKRTAHVRVILESQETAVTKKAVKPTKGTTTEAKATEGKEIAKPAAPRISLQMPKAQVGKTQTTVKTVTVRKTGER
jgi:large subunit ribosomal protein L22